MNTQNEKRSIFDWLIFTLIHVVVIGAISVVGFYVYGFKLAIWVAASATVAGLASCYLFAKDIPGETFMKCWLYLFVAANAGYLAHNGAQKVGVEDYNAAQVKKFELGMAEAGKATSRRVARELRLGAENASKLERTLSDSVSVIVAILAFLELASALLIFAIGSRRIAKPEPIVAQQARVVEQPGRELARRPTREFFDDVVDVPVTGRLDEPAGKARRQ